MSAIVKDIMNWMEEIAPASLAEGWDQTGLAVGNPEQKVGKILVALDVIEPVIDEAILMGADMIVTHHPMLLFQKITDIRRDNPLGNRIYKLIQNDISAFSAHTNLDIAEGGTNDILAELAGLQNVTYLEETNAQTLHKIVTYVPAEFADKVRDAMCQAGAGHIGGYSHCTFGAKGEGTFLPLDGAEPFVGSVGELARVAEVRLESIVPAEKTNAVVTAIRAVHPYEEMAYDIYPVVQKGKREGIGRVGALNKPVEFQAFAEELRQKLGLQHIRLVGRADKMVQRVALCTGSGASFIDDAKRAGADVYLTADIKYHEAQGAIESDLCIVDVTHYASEVLAVPVLRDYLEKRAKESGLGDIEVVCSKVDGQTFWEI